MLPQRDSAENAPILVVDDDAVSRRVLALTLGRAGFEYVTAVDGNEALTYVAAHPVELILLDLVMPKPDGYDVLRRLRADPRTRDVPVVVLTGVDADDEVARAFAAGADDFVRKPFRADELIARIRGQRRLRATQLELREREKELELVLEITQTLASNLDIRAILQIVVQRIADIAEVDRVSIVLAQPDPARAVVVAASDDESIRDLHLELDKYPEISRVLETREALVVDDVAGHPLFELSPHLIPNTFRSLAILPIAYEERPLGVLFLRAEEQRTFSARELSLCHTVAAATAIALRNARVLQHLREETAEVRVEAAKKIESLQRFADFIESSADGLVAIDRSGALLFSNRRAQEITGYHPQEFSGRSVLEVLKFEREDLATPLREFQQHRYPADVDLRFTTRGGERRTVNVNFSSVLHEQGLILCALRDVTEARAMERELAKTKERLLDKERQAAVAALAGAAAHELNQPLQSVLVYLELLLRKSKEDPSAHKPLAVIRGEVERMAEIVRKIGAITRYETKAYVGGQEILDLDRASLPISENPSDER